MKLHKKTEKLCAPNTKLSYEWYGYEIYKFWVELSSKITENRQIIHFLCTYALPLHICTSSAHMHFQSGGIKLFLQMLIISVTFDSYA